LQNRLTIKISKQKITSFSQTEGLSSRHHEK
jgi:hypothetical protein